MPSIALCAFSLLLALPAQAQEGRDMSCLSPAQQQALTALSHELSEQFQIRNDMERYRIASTAQTDLQAEVQDCLVKLNEPIQLIDNIFSNCCPTLAKFNNLNWTASQLSARIKLNSEIIFDRPRLERAQLPPCNWAAPASAPAPLGRG